MILFLSRANLNFFKRTVQRDLSDFHEMHRTICRRL